MNILTRIVIVITPDFTYNWPVAHVACTYGLTMYHASLLSPVTIGRHNQCRQNVRPTDRCCSAEPVNEA